VNTYSLAHLSDSILLRDLAVLVTKERGITAQLLAHLAEVDSRKLYVAAGYPSLYLYCVQELLFSEDAALKRIRVARAASKVPALLPAVADGSLNLNAVLLLAPHLTTQNADELIGAAAGKTRPEIEHLIAERFPRSETLAMVHDLSVPTSEEGEVELGQAGSEATAGSVDQLAARPPEVSNRRRRMSPIAPRRYEVQVTIDQSTHDKLRHAQALMSPKIPPGDLAAVLDRVLDLAIAQLEKHKLGAGRTSPSARTTANPRRIPKSVRAAVWQRDGGRCTFVSENGRRCSARDRLEFDHIVPVARGGLATTENLRLRCSVHNQYEAERTFGADFIRRKRDQSRRAAEQRQRAAREKASEVIPWLRALQVPPAIARQAAAHCMAVAADSPVEERVRVALSYLGSRIARPRGFAKGSATSNVGATDLAFSSTNPSTSCSTAPP
jgi:hypothetical protein